MIYAEAAYFDGYHFAHIAARDEQQRLDRKRRNARAAIERERRSRPRYAGAPRLRLV